MYLCFCICVFGPLALHLDQFGQKNASSFSLTFSFIADFKFLDETAVFNCFHISTESDPQQKLLAQNRLKIFLFVNNKFKIWSNAGPAYEEACIEFLQEG